MIQQDACTLLDEDHKKVERLFAEYQSVGSDGARKSKLAQAICHELLVHTQIEDEIFYPAFLEATGNDKLLEDARKEHQEARQMIEQIQGAQPDDQLVTKLQKAIEHHVGDERQKMFPEARRTQGLDLMELADRLEKRKAELMAGHPA